MGACVSPTAAIVLSAAAAASALPPPQPPPPCTPCSDEPDYYIQSNGLSCATLANLHNCNQTAHLAG